MVKQPKKSRLAWGIALAAVGIVGFPGAGNTERPALYLITCILLVVGGALLTIFYARASKAYKRKKTEEEEKRRHLQAGADSFVHFYTSCLMAS